MTVEADRLKDIKKFEAEIATLQAENAKVNFDVGAMNEILLASERRAEAAEAQLREARARALEEAADEMVIALDEGFLEAVDWLRARAAAARQETP